MGQTVAALDMRQLVQALHETLGDSAPRRGPGARAPDTALELAPGDLGLQEALRALMAP